MGEASLPPNRPHCTHVFVPETPPMQRDAFELNRAIIVDARLVQNHTPHLVQAVLMETCKSDFAFQLTHIQGPQYMLLPPHGVDRHQFQLAHGSALQKQGYVIYPWTQAINGKPLKLKYKVWLQLIGMPPQAWTLTHLLHAVGSIGPLLDHTPMASVLSLEKMMAVVAVHDLGNIPQNVCLVVRGISRPIEILVHSWIEEPIPFIPPLDTTPKEEFFEQVRRTNRISATAYEKDEQGRDLVTIEVDTLLDIWHKLEPSERTVKLAAALQANPYFANRQRDIVGSEFSTGGNQPPHQVADTQVHIPQSYNGENVAMDGSSVLSTGQLSKEKKGGMDGSSVLTTGQKSGLDLVKFNEGLNASFSPEISPINLTFATANSETRNTRQKKNPNPNSPSFILTSPNPLNPQTITTTSSINPSPNPPCNLIHSANYTPNSSPNTHQLNQNPNNTTPHISAQDTTKTTQNQTPTLSAQKDKHVRCLTPYSPLPPTKESHPWLFNAKPLRPQTAEELKEIAEFNAWLKETKTMEWLNEPAKIGQSSGSKGIVSEVEPEEYESDMSLSEPEHMDLDHSNLTSPTSPQTETNPLTTLSEQTFTSPTIPSASQITPPPPQPPRRNRRKVMVSELRRSARFSDKPKRTYATAKPRNKKPPPLIPPEPHDDTILKALSTESLATTPLDCSTVARVGAFCGIAINPFEDPTPLQSDPNQLLVDPNHLLVDPNPIQPPPTGSAVPNPSSEDTYNYEYAESALPALQFDPEDEISEEESAGAGI